MEVQSSLREKWGSRTAFIVAAIGSAIGFGNVWRFPSLVFQYGGGAFFIPYVLALLLIGIPILILEISVGQFYQTGDAGAFGRINKRFRGVGIASVLCSFVVTLYYCVLLAWVLRMFLISFQGSDGKWGNVSGEIAYDWFRSNVTGFESAKGMLPTKIILPNLLALAIVWFFVFLSLAFGIRITGRIAYFTVGLPVLFLIILLIRSSSLPGSREGVKAYIGNWDFRVLVEQPGMWSEAVSQIFFSIGITFGVMTAYASYMDRNSPVFANSLFISLGNSFYSFIAGFAVFGVVGYTANLVGTSIEEVNIRGPALIFATYPLALSTLPGHGHWERLFFVALFFLGIDSAFAFTEAVTTVVSDTMLFRNVDKRIILAFVCTAGFLGGLLFVTDTGLLWLETTDFYVNFMLLLVGILETFAAGWVYGIENQIEKLGTNPVIFYMVATYLPLIVASTLWFGTSSGSLWKGFVALVLSYIMLMIGVVLSLRRSIKSKLESKEMTFREAIIELLMGNVLKLRDDLEGVVQYIPLVWFFLIRHFIPPVLVILFVNLAASKNSNNKAVFGNYSSYPTPYQAVGILVFSFALMIVVTGIVFPNIYKCFEVVQIKLDPNDVVEEEDGTISD